jgi:hypothetical protein
VDNLDNVTAYVGTGLTRATVTNVTQITNATNFTIAATSNFYIAVVPINSRLTSNFTMNYKLAGSVIPEDTSFEDAFWPKAIGIVVGVLAFVGISLGVYMYAQKHGGFSNCWKALKTDTTH